MTQEAMNQEVDKNLFRFAGRELAGGGDRTPLTEFTGKLATWDVAKSQFDATVHNIVFKFESIQVISVQEGSGPYPFDHAEISVKHSGSERSGFGMLISSMDKALGASKQQSDLDKYMGQEWHFHSERYNWGKIPGSTVADENGDTWGNIWQASLAGSVASTFVEAPVKEADEVIALSPEEKAMSLLDGKTQSEWIPLVVQDAEIQQDMALFQSIMSNQWLASKIASGEISPDDQDRFHVSK